MLAEAMTTIGTTVEDELVTRLRAGEPAAYEALVREHGARLLNTARRYLPEEADAEDAVQDTFVAVLRSVDGFGGNAKLSTWLHRIVVNCCLMKMRSRRRRPEESIVDLRSASGEEWEWSEPASDWSTPVESGVHGEELNQALRSCIGSLPERYQTILQHRVVEELDTDEVAARLGITANAVKIRLHRARQALHTLLELRLGADVPTRISAAGVTADPGWRAAAGTSGDRTAPRDTRKQQRARRSRHGALVA